MNSRSVLLNLLPLVLINVRTSLGAEPLDATKSEFRAAANEFRAAAHDDAVGDECRDLVECAGKRSVARRVARDTHNSQGSQGFFSAIQASLKDIFNPAADQGKPPVRRITHDDEEAEALFSGSFITELGIACIGFSITALLQRYVGRKNRIVRRKGEKTSGQAPMKCQKLQGAVVEAPSAQGGYAVVHPSRDALFAMSDALPHSLSYHEEESIEVKGQSKLQKGDMRRLLALVTSKPPLREVPSMVLRCVTSIEARSGKLLNTEQVLDALIQLLRACAASKCFKEGLAAFDCLHERVSGTGDHTLWSLLLYVATEAGSYDRCEDFYMRLQHDPGPAGRDFVNVVRAYAKRNDLEGLKAAIEALGQTQPESIIYDRVVRNRALQACCKEGAVELAVVLADTDVFKRPLDNVGYNTLITCFARAGCYQRSFDTFDQMDARGVQPTESTFGSLLEACCGANDVNRARHYVSKIQAYGLSINAVHCTTLIKALVSEKYLADAERLLEESSNNNVRLDIIAFYTVIKAYTDSGDMKAALRVYESMGRHGVKPDEFVFNVLINGCSESNTGVDTFNLLLDRLLADGMKPTTTTLSIMLKALASSRAWDEALALLESAPSRFNAKVETRLYVQLAQAAIKSGDKDKAIIIHDVMVTTQGRRGQEGKAASRWLLRQCDALSRAKRGKVDQAMVSSTSSSE